MKKLTALPVLLLTLVILATTLSACAGDATSESDASGIEQSSGSKSIESQTESSKEESKVTNIPGLGEELEKKIKEDWLAHLQNRSNSDHYSNITANDIQVRFIDKCSNGVVIIMDYPRRLGVLDVWHPELVIIGGYDFWIEFTHARPYFYNDSNFLSFEQAYEQGLLLHTELYDLSKHFSK
ncbi:MAG: hypothetical protein FWG69_03770 [Oscillospiraceae bacterium]|nr:hypothetical protein [Oscillospiraceae bacterium]